jgi:hypothetical protein
LICLDGLETVPDTDRGDSTTDLLASSLFIEERGNGTGGEVALADVIGVDDV